MNAELSRDGRGSSNWTGETPMMRKLCTTVFLSVLLVCHARAAHSGAPTPASDARTGINDIAVNKITYAAKSCVLGKVPSSRNKSALPEGAAQRILCFDFTTQEHDLLPLMLAFTMQFDGRSLQPVVPGSILR